VIRKEIYYAKCPLPFVHGTLAIRINTQYSNPIRDVDKSYYITLEILTVCVHFKTKVIIIIIIIQDTKILSSLSS